MMIFIIIIVSCSDAIVNVRYKECDFTLASSVRNGQLTVECHPLSIFWLSPGRMGRAFLALPINGDGFLSIHTTGLSGLYGSSYTSSTSSMQAMDLASSFAGMHQ